MKKGYINIQLIKTPKGEEWIRKKDLLRYLRWLKKEWQEYPARHSLLTGIIDQINKKV